MSKENTHKFIFHFKGSIHRWNRRIPGKLFCRKKNISVSKIELNDIMFIERRVDKNRSANDAILLEYIWAWLTSLILWTTKCSYTVRRSICGNTENWCFWAFLSTASSVRIYAICFSHSTRKSCLCCTTQTVILSDNLFLTIMNDYSITHCSRLQHIRRLSVQSFSSDIITIAHFSSQIPSITTY